MYILFRPVRGLSCRGPKRIKYAGSIVDVLVPAAAANTGLLSSLRICQASNDRLKVHKRVGSKARKYPSDSFSGLVQFLVSTVRMRHFDICVQLQQVLGSL